MWNFFRVALSAVSNVAVRRRPNNDGTTESREPGTAGGGIDSLPFSVEYSELPADEDGALLSRLSLPLRLKSVLPKICTLSGRSRNGMAPVTDLPDDFRERDSSAFSHEGRSVEVSERNDEEPEDVVV